MEKISSLDSFADFVASKVFAVPDGPSKRTCSLERSARRDPLIFSISLFKITFKFLFDTDDGAF